MPTLWNGFEGHAVISESHLENAVRGGQVFFDTNVLLNLYRYLDDSTDAFFRAMQGYGDRLHIPHQVAHEFWKNRINVMRGIQHFAAAMEERFEDAFANVNDQIAEWEKRAGAKDGVGDELYSLVRKAQAGVLDRMREVENGRDRSENTEEDAILQRLADVLGDRVGNQPTPTQLEEDRKEAFRRIESKLAPGFADKTKGPDAANDYFVWVQSLRMAHDLGATDIIFVTGDLAKRDWVADPESLVPFPILVNDARTIADASLAIISPERFLQLTRNVLEVDISDAAIRAAATEVRAERWTDAKIAEFMRRLAHHDELRHKVLLAACESGGNISRAELYEIAEYPETRTLAQFARPITTVMAQMGMEPYSDDLNMPLEALYGNGPGPATGYKAAPEFVEWHHRDKGTDPSQAGTEEGK